MQELSTLLSYPNILDVATFGVSSLLIYSGVVGAYIDPLGCKYSSKNPSLLQLFEFSLTRMPII